MVRNIKSEPFSTIPRRFFRLFHSFYAPVLEQELELFHKMDWLGKIG